VAPKRVAVPAPLVPAPSAPQQGYSVDTKSTVAESSVAVPAVEGGGNAFADPSQNLPPAQKPSVRPAPPAEPERFEAAQWITSAVDRSPPYPAAALRNRIEGQVILRVCVGPSGGVDTVQLVKGLGFGCDEAAASWARTRWRFTPARRGGKPVTTCLLQPMRFQLER
jgi:protein TonB